MGNFYVVIKGHNPGIYEDWNVCKNNVNGYSRALYKKFSSLQYALTWYEENGGDTSLIPEKYLADKQEESSKKIDSNKIKTPANDVEYEELIHKLHLKLSSIRQLKEKCTKDLEEFCIKYDFEHLSNAQKLAVQTVKGKSLLFAVPGSGKTTVLIARTGYLLHGQNDVLIRPNMLMNLTFTVAAAKEMAARYSKKFNEYDSDEQPAFMTIHSFCWNKIIPQLHRRNFPMPTQLINTDKNDNQDAMFSDLSDDDIDEHERDLEEKSVTLYKVLKKILIHFKLSRRDDTVRERISSLITYIKNRQLSSEEYKDKILVVEKTSCPVKEIFDIYQDELKNYKCMDFDDMLQYSLSGLKRYPDLLKQLQEQYLYWSVDETQDNSKLQNELISLLVGDNGNLFVVGDDDQSIYNFRGAEPMLLLNYGVKDNVKTMVMDTNYRSGKTIIEIAKMFIENNRYRADKQMKSSYHAPYSQINFYTAFSTEQDQYNHIVETAKTCIQNNKTLAIIYRLNASSLPVMFWLKKHGIKFNVVPPCSG